jgi:hypothetical protein
MIHHHQEMNVNVFINDVTQQEKNLQIELDRIQNQQDLVYK